MAPRLTAVNRYRTLAAPEAVEIAVAALVARVEAEGERGVNGYRFFHDPQAGEMRAIVDYASPEAWIGHHETAMGWPEMARLREVAQLAEVTLLGEVTDAITDWLDGSSITAQIVTDLPQISGFVR